MCINDLDSEGKPIQDHLFGATGSSKQAATLEVNFKPCKPKQLTDKNKHLVNTECIADLNDKRSLKKKLQDSKDYLGRP